jgi:hypothetical protein
MVLLYIGAWSDFSVVRFFPTTNKFIFVDTQPRNEFDDDHPVEESLFERPYFLEQIFQAAKIESFELISKKVLKVYSENKLKNPTLYKFKSKAKADAGSEAKFQEIDYYVSSNFRKDELPELNKEIKKCDGIIVSGYFPHSDLFKMFDNNINIYLMSGTYYSKINFNETGEDENNIINYLYDNEDLTNKSNNKHNLFQVLKDTNQIIPLSKMSDVKNS